MIYTRWGDEVKICGNYGEHKVKDFPFPLMLVKVRYIEDGNRERFWFTQFLRADKGLQEIEDVMISLDSLLKLSKVELTLAIEQAS